MITIDYFFDTFKITDEEYRELDKKFGDLCYSVAWDLKRKNSNNNLTDEIEDIAQDIRWSMSCAGVYTKRQRYIESCFKTVKIHVNDDFIQKIINVLEDLWRNRTRHGANRQRFGLWQENILDKIVNTYAPINEKPSKSAKLEIDKKFTTYCKAVLWNRSKNLGKKITRERSIRSGLVSLSDHDLI